MNPRPPAPQTAIASSGDDGPPASGAWTIGSASVAGSNTVADCLQVGGGVVEPVIAPEQLLADRDRGHAEHAAIVRRVGGLAQRLLDLRVDRTRADRFRIKTGSFRGLE